MRSVLDKSCRENQNTYFMFNIFFRKSCRLWDNVEKYSGARGATNDVTIWRIGFACCISKVINTHAQAHGMLPGTRRHARTSARLHTDKYVTLIFQGNINFVNKPQYYVICTLSVLFKIIYNTWHLSKFPAKWYYNDENTNAYEYTRK